jgi:tellurite resistance protein
MPNPTRSYQSVLLDAIFHEQDKHLREAFRKRLEKMERREQLTQVSGIRDEAVLDRLIELGITPETLAVLELVPLVFVAWADGRVQAEEREVIIALAKSAGIEPQDGRYPLLEHWLKRRPGAEMLEAWKQYVQEIRRQLDAKDAEELRHELLDRTYSVARAAGGFLGFGDKMSPAERSVLDRLEEVFA